MVSSSHKRAQQELGRGDLIGKAKFPLVETIKVSRLLEIFPDYSGCWQFGAKKLMTHEADKPLKLDR
jgi:hypothetical protein